MKSALDIEAAQEDLDFAAGAYLRAAGWKHTSSTPGCYWMYLREIDGTTYAVDLKHAVRIQRHLEDSACNEVHEA